MIVANVMSIDPKYSGQGVDTMLLKRGLEDVDKAHAKAYIEAFPLEYDVFKALGWKVVDEIKINTKEFGGTSENEVCSLMMRDSQ